MEHLKKLFGGNLRQFGMLITLVVMVGLFQILTRGRVWTPTNLMNLLNGNSYILVLAIGMVLVIIAGHIDLSVGSVAAFVGIVVAIAMRDWGVPWWAGILLGIVLGAVIGAWQGFWMAYVGIPGFIVTLAGYLFFRGANQFVGKSNTVPVPEAFQVIGAGYLPEWGPDTGMNNSTLLVGVLAVVALAVFQIRGRAKLVRVGAEVPPMWATITRIVLLSLVIVFVTIMYASGRPGTSFPISGLILVALVFLYSFFSQKTPIGRHIYAVGGNRHAAELSGVNSKTVYFLVMVNMSTLAALAGMMFVARSTASGPFDGVGWELDAIAAVFIGGAAVSGGVGTVVGSMVGGLVMAVLNNGLDLMGAGADWKQMIKGLVLLLAVAVDVWNKQQGRPSITGLLLRRRAAQQMVSDIAEPTEETPPVEDVTQKV
ncbi:multiple monosaccharide ABC transporter permease [Propionicicella superfundia]|uniref:multiple monosaccharide ABC transporter permease n=1 Tax=Propionicicella superfundia TaxID=348582 RepID=UPI00041D4726|nr:multiple monosaccharide ABC transporter permease [Propionicicella superfundia]